MAKTEAFGKDWGELETMTTRELVSYNNILNMSGRCLVPDPRDRAKNKAHKEAVAAILEERVGMPLTQFGRLVREYGKEKAIRAAKWFCESTRPEARGAVHQARFCIANEYLWF